MKKILLFLKDALKATIGIPIFIGCTEIFNLIISLVIGEYVRIDGGILQNVIKSYITGGLMGYGIALIMFSLNREINDENKDVLQKSRNLILYVWIVLVIITVINGIMVSDLKMTLILVLAYSATFGLGLLSIYLWDKVVINKINKKIKENQNK